MEILLNFITAAGYWGYGILFLIIFLESFPPTFFLPGDSLLFITGFLAYQGYFNMGLLVLTLFLASVLGYMFSYAMGKKIGEIIENSNDKYWFKKSHLEYTEEFYQKHGLKTVVIGRFIPIVRSFNPTLAGAGEMAYPEFMKMVMVGGFLWTGGLTLIGYYLGHVVPDAHKYITPIVLIIIAVSMFPAVFELLKRFFRRNRVN